VPLAEKSAALNLTVTGNNALTNIANSVYTGQTNACISVPDGAKLFIGGVAGSLTVKGGFCRAVIGGGVSRVGGSCADAGVITITGGTVTANGGSYDGAGIS